MTCEGCCNRIRIPGNCHIGCKNTGAQVQTRRWSGCGVWPIAFDENIVIACSGKNQEVTEVKSNPMIELMRLMS